MPSQHGNSTGPVLQPFYQWVCCYCKWTNHYATHVQCINCSHILEKPHCKIEVHYPRYEGHLPPLPTPAPTPAPKKS